MSEEIGQAIQIIRVAYDGVEIAMKIGSGTMEQMKKIMDLLVGMLEYEKLHGKTSMKKLLVKGGDLQVFQFESQEIKKVEHLAKKYGILYSVLPDVNKLDGKSEIIFHSEAVPRVNMMIQKLKFGCIATFDDYLKNGNEKELNKLLDFLKYQKQGNELVHTDEAERANELLGGLIEKVGLFAMEKQIISVDAIKENFHIDRTQAEEAIRQLEAIGVLNKGDTEGQHKVIMDKEAFQRRIAGYKDLTSRMRAISSSKNLDLVDITINRKMIVEENEHAIKTRIPGGQGTCLWINKDDLMEIHDGKTVLTFLNKEKDYKIYSKDNRILHTMKGKDLYNSHYDPVSAEVRRRYEKIKPESRVEPVARKR